MHGDDEWDVRTLGADGAKEPNPGKKGESLMGLVQHFRDMTAGIMSLNSPTNGPALIKIFKGLKQKGVTHKQITQMIDLFAFDIRKTPLPSDVPAWRGFAGRLDNLHKRVGESATTYDYSEYGVDTRFLKKESNE
jgi:hypothetical protein